MNTQTHGNLRCSAHSARTGNVTVAASETVPCARDQDGSRIGAPAAAILRVRPTRGGRKHAHRHRRGNRLLTCSLWWW